MADITYGRRMIRHPRGNGYLYLKRLRAGFPRNGWLSTTIRCIYCAKQWVSVVQVRHAVALDCPYCKRSECGVGIPLCLDDVCDFDRNEPENTEPEESDP